MASAGRVLVMGRAGPPQRPAARGEAYSRLFGPAWNATRRAGVLDARPSLQRPARPPMTPTRSALRGLIGLGAAACALALPAAGLAETNYAVALKTGIAVPHGQKDAGNHCDDCVTELRLPFAAQLFGVRYTRALVSSNGNLQFTASADAATGANAFLPT